MKEVKTQQIRNVGFFGHGDDGKTSLCEVILFLGGENNRIGSVDEGNSLLDFEPEEVDRKLTLSLSVGHIFWKDAKINIIDTPGYPNFFSEAIVAMSVVDTAVIVSDTSEVKLQAEKAWKLASERGVPRAVFVTKMDDPSADFYGFLDKLKERFEGVKFVPITLPIGSGDSFKGVFDVISGKAFIYQDDRSGKYQEDSVQDDKIESARSDSIESIIEMDDEVMEKYLEGEELPKEDILRCLKKGMESGELVPVFCGSSLKNIGVSHFLDYIVSTFPDPSFRKEVTGKNPSSGEEVKRRISVDEPTSCFVFKTISDPFAGKITIFKIFSGVVTPDMTLYNPNKLVREKIGGLFALIGKKQKNAPKGVAGDILATTKLKETSTMDTLCDEKNQIVYPPVELPQAVISYAIEPKTKGDEEKIINALHRLMEEDPSIKISRNEQTKELLLSGMGQTHIEVIVEKLKRKFGVEVNMKEPKVPYKETIKAKARAQGKYKKQTGGRGQYGDCWLEIEPLPRGKEFEFVDKIVGGVIPKQFIPAVEKGVREAMQSGILAGYPVTDVKVTVYDGSHHPVDSSELAFKIAGSLAFKKAMEQAKPVLLEPIMKLEIIVPEECMGDVIGDLNSRRGKVQGFETKAGWTTIRALVPMAEVLKYAPALRSITSGRGEFTMEFSHYEEVPPQIAQKIIEEARAEREKGEK